MLSIYICYNKSVSEMNMMRNLQNTTHSKFTRRLLCYLRTSFLEEIFNGDLPLGFACLAEFNYFSTSLYWE